MRSSKLAPGCHEPWTSICFRASFAQIGRGIEGKGGRAFSVRFSGKRPCWFVFNRKGLRVIKGYRRNLIKKPWSYNSKALGPILYRTPKRVRRCLNQVPVLGASRNGVGSQELKPKGASKTEAPCGGTPDGYILDHTNYNNYSCNL